MKTSLLNIPRKFFCQLIYRKLESVKDLILKQYEDAIKRYPVLGKIYSLLREFHRIIYSVKVRNWNHGLQKQN